MQNINAKLLCKSFLMAKFVISVATGNRGEKGDGKHQILVVRPIKQQPFLGGLLTHAHHNLEENHSYFSQQLFKKGSSPHLPASVLPHGASPRVCPGCATAPCHLQVLSFLLHASQNPVLPFLLLLLAPCLVQRCWGLSWRGRSRPCPCLQSWHVEEPPVTPAEASSRAKRLRDA